ncbi:MAG: alpha/beta hydrolase [Gammaproteobacteria bacterium]|nr:alpha/beta hydrolase [Gammaproteobacteria bacterium]
MAIVDMDKPPILLLHAALGAKDQLAPLANQFADAFTVLTMDFDGHGERAAAGEELRYETMAADAVALLDEHGLNNVPVFGHSMGGYVGLFLCVHFPERVRALHTLGTFFEWGPESAGRMLTELNADVIAEKVPNYAAALEARHTGIGWRAVIERTAGMIERTGAAPPVALEQLAEVRQPVRVGVGDRDHLTSVDACMKLSRALPNGEMIVFPRAGHPIERTPLDMLGYSIRDFVKAV